MVYFQGIKEACSAASLLTKDASEFGNDVSKILKN